MKFRSRVQKQMKNSNTTVVHYLFSDDATSVDKEKVDQICSTNSIR